MDVFENPSAPLLHTLYHFSVDPLKPSAPPLHDLPPAPHSLLHGLSGAPGPHGLSGPSQAHGQFALLHNHNKRLSEALTPEAWARLTDPWRFHGGASTDEERNGLLQRLWVVFRQVISESDYQQALCAQMAAELGHVQAQLDVLKHRQLRVEQSHVRSAGAQRSGGAVNQSAYA